MNYLCRNPTLVWRAIPEIHIEKEDFTVISVKDIHKKYLCLLQPQRSRRLTAATAYFISPPSAAVNTTINPNIIFHINVLTKNPSVVNTLCINSFRY